LGLNLTKLKVKLLDILAGKQTIILNREDAEKIGVHVHDRVRVQSGSNQITAIVQVTATFIDSGQIGIMKDIAEKLHVKDGDEVNIRLASYPESLEYIRKKLKGVTLSKDEIFAIVRDVVEGNLSDLEIAAYLLAEEFYGMSMEEVEYMARAMADVGEKIDFEEPVYDKHSIGGVPGNKVSLLIVPIVAAAGLLIPKTSSKAITSPAGTADTMEVLAPVKFTAQELKDIAKKVRGAIVWGGGLNIAPADDIFIRVEYPLALDPESQMLASIMSKKLAVGVDFLVLDIPTGKGAKVETMNEARTLARKFVELGERLGIHVECGITYGGQPVGHVVGPALEAREALLALQGKGPTSLIEKSTALAGILLELGGLAMRGKGKGIAMEILTSGKALKKMREIIEAQGGDPNVEPEDIPVGEHRVRIEAPCDGYITDVSNDAIKKIARAAGAPMDKGAGIILYGKRGHKVKRGEPILEICAERESRLSEAYALAMKLQPITVEGMLLQRIPEYR